MKITLVPVPIAAGVSPLDALQLPNGQRGATVRSLCQALDIAPNMQVARIRRNPKLAQALVVVEVSTPGGPQQADVLVGWAIPIWAAGLHISRLPEAKREAAILLQRKAFAAIEQAFVQPEHTAPPPEVPVHVIPQNGLHQMREGLLLAVQGIDNFEVEHQALVERVTVLECEPAHPVIGYSPQRLSQMYLLANRVRQRLGYPIAQTLAGLADHFHVADVFDLPERDWPAILTWFGTLLEE